MMNKQNNIKNFLAVSLLAVTICSAYGNPQPRQGSDAPEPEQKQVQGMMFSVTDERNTSATSTVKGEELYKTPSVNVSNSLVGLLPGFTVLQGSGEPGNDDARWLIRGIGSHGFGGYSGCKIYVDGFEVNSNYFTSLSPGEIESVSVLKDGAALALFGDRGANGVLWITTKRGKSGQAVAKINVRSGVHIPTIINKPLGSFDYASLYNIAASNDKGTWSPFYDNAQMTGYKNGTGIDVDWYDEVMRKSGLYAEGDVSFSGGNNIARYNIMLGYINQQGLFDNTSTRSTSNLLLSRYNVRANLDFDINKVFSARVDIGGKLTSSSRPVGSSGSDVVDNIMYHMATMPNNVYNVYDDDERTRISGTEIYPNNPVGSIKRLGYRNESQRILQGNFALKEKLDFITPGLFLEQMFSVNTATLSSQNFAANYARYHNGTIQTANKDEDIQAGGRGSDGMDDWKQGIFQAGYDRAWGKHVVSAAAGAHISAYKGDGYFLYRYNYLNYRARVNYAFDNRYVAEVGLSVFGNDAFAPAQRWSQYPTVSGAWIISNEEFLKGNEVINHLKIRASFGMSGSGDSESSELMQLYQGSNGRFLFKEYYSTTNPYGSFYSGDSKGDWQTTLVPKFVPNKDARAETSYKYNLGFDASMFNGRLSLTADFFLDKRHDILTLDRSILNYYGWNSSMTNIGQMTNRGFELMAVYGDRAGDWSYKAMAMVSFNRNRIDNIGEVLKKHDYNMTTGNPYGSIIGLESVGFYDISDFDASGNLIAGIPTPAYGRVQPGDLRYRDRDANGVVDDDDVSVVGKPYYPEWTYSFGATVAYKRFDLNVLLQGVGGSSINLLNYPELFVPFDGNTTTAYQVASNAWAYYPDQGIDTRKIADYPRLTTEQNNNNYHNSSFWVKSNNYLKVRHIELGYTFKLSSLEKTNMRAYFNVANPFTFSKIMKDYDMDPERPGYGYPSLKTYTLGVTLNF